MRKIFITAGLIAGLATPALAQGMAAQSGNMQGPSAMAANDTMKMDHKKAKKSAMKHDAMGAGMSGPMASDGMAKDGMAHDSMKGPGH